VSSLDGSAPLLALLGAETARGTGALSRCGGRAATAARRSCRLSPGRTSISDIAAQRARSGAALVPARAQAVIKSEVRPEAAPVLHPFGKCNYYTFVKIPCSDMEPSPSSTLIPFGKCNYYTFAKMPCSDLEPSPSSPSSTLILITLINPHPFGKCNYYTFAKIPCSGNPHPDLDPSPPSTLIPLESVTITLSLKYLTQIWNPHPHHPHHPQRTGNPHPDLDPSPPSTLIPLESVTITLSLKYLTQIWNPHPHHPHHPQRTGNPHPDLEPSPPSPSLPLESVTITLSLKYLAHRDQIQFLLQGGLCETFPRCPNFSKQLGCSTSIRMCFQHLFAICFLHIFTAR
jgi:hypothetical protein